MKKILFIMSLLAIAQISYGIIVISKHIDTYHGEGTIGSNMVCDIATTHNSSILNIDGSTVGMAYSVDSSRINFYDGVIDYIYVDNDSEFHYYGGEITGFMSFNTADIFNNSRFHVYGTELDYTYGDTFIKGISTDGVPFSIWTRTAGEYEGKIVLHEIPEPATMLMLGLGVLFTIRKKL